MHWLRNLFFRKHANDDLAEEIREHIAERTAVLIEQGRDPEEAAREARCAFGNITLARERSVEVWQWRWLENLWADIRFALHQFRKSPGYTLTAILTLAIGIGANAAIFTLIDDIMLRSLPISHPEQLVEIGFRSPTQTDFIHGQSIRMIDFLHAHTTGLQDLSAVTDQMVTLPDSQGTLRSIRVALVSGTGLSVLGVRPYLGRLLTPADDVAGGPEGGWPVVLDYGFWQANYHGDPGLLGRVVFITSHPAVIVGVLPKDFGGIFNGIEEKAYLPLHFASASAGSPPNDPYIHPEQISQLAIGRLRDGTSLGTLNTELAAFSSSVRTLLYPEDIRRRPNLHNATLVARSASRGVPFIEAEYRQPLLLLQGIVLVVLLLCCTNLAGLQMARIQARQHEFAVRSALGAGRGRILQQCLTESLLLAFAGSLLAAALGWSSTATLATFLTPAGAAQNTVLRPDAHVLIITTALALVTTLLFGLAPALIANRTSPGVLLKSKGIQQRGRILHRHIFIPAQFALALLLVLGGGLFSQTLVHLRSSNAGFEPSHIVDVAAQFESLRKTPEEFAALYRSMVDSLRSAPGVQAATTAWITPLKGFAPSAIVHSSAPASGERSVAFNFVGDGYFATLGTRLLTGHEFTASDRDFSICIVNRSAARALLPSRALGNSVAVTDGSRDFNATCRVVGVVEDAHYTSLRDPAPPTLYLPVCASTFTHSPSGKSMYFMIRSHTDAEAIAAYRATLARYAPNTGVMTFLPLRDQVDQSLGSERLIAILTNTFAAIALLLSAIGIFGLLALRVQERTPEFGVRIAVGATRSHLLRMVLGDALRMVAIGSVCGLALASIGYIFIRRFLYGASSADIRVALASLLVLIAVAILAAAIPARRAASLDPMQALRAE